MSHLGRTEAGTLQIEWDEDGCTLRFETTEGDDHAVVISPEELHEIVRVQIGPWIAEMEGVRREFARRPDPPEDTEEPDWDAVRDSARGK